MKKILLPLAASLILSTGVITTPQQPAYACGLCFPTVQKATTEGTSTSSDLQSSLTDYFSDYFSAQEDWLNDFWDNNILVALKGMADQLSATAIYQGYVIGTFFDAQTQLDTQRSLQKIRARTHKDYQPSVGMCQFGSAAKSLAASEQRGDLTALVLNRRSQDRLLGNTGAVSALGSDKDLESRINLFKETYCSPADNSGGLDVMCLYDGGVGASDITRMNKDIDYARTLSSPWTLQIDFSDTTTQDDEVDVVALSNNLYGHTINAVSPQISKITSGSDTQARNYLDARALLAKQSVAQNSYNSLVAMKSEGSEGAKTYLDAVIKELGVTDTNDINEMIGEKPSYYAQMEVLTKKMYQNPDFYTNLYDKPANVQRKKVAMQAIALMQKFDIFRSQLRSEANTALLLEMAVAKRQNDLER